VDKLPVGGHNHQQPEDGERGCDKRRKILSPEVELRLLLDAPVAKMKVYSKALAAKVENRDVTPVVRRKANQ
jgi:hypothetical protein